MIRVRLSFVVAAALLLASSAAAAIAVDVHGTTTIDNPAVTAVLVIDAQLADASVRNGIVTITGRSAGTTQIVLITAAGSMTLPLTVRAPKAAFVSAATASPEHVTAGVRYTSGSSQVQGSIDYAQQHGDRKTEAHLLDVHTVSNRFPGEPANTLRAVTWKTSTSSRELTLFDDVVNNSPLTVDDTIVRGVHLIENNWRLHAGYTSNALFDSFVIPARRELVLGTAYAWRISPRSQLMPSLYVFPTQQQDAGRRGGVASLLWDYRDGNALHAQTELGISRGVGAAGLLEWNSDTNRLRVDVRHRPRSFAAAGPVDLHGTYGEATWSTRPSTRLSVELSAEANHFQLPKFDQRTANASADLRYALSRRYTVLGGATWSRFGSIRGETIPLGLQFDAPHFGASILGRYAANNATNRGGFGYRATSRLSFGSFLVDGYFDRQADAPTVDLIFREDPELALALDQLGISVNSPADVARALRDNPALISLGFIEGVNIHLAPLRTQAAFEAAWLGNSSRRPQIRLRLLRTRTETVTSATTASIASLTYSQRITSSFDVYAGWSREVLTSEPIAGKPRQFVEVGVRHSFDALPRAGLTETIRGFVFRDDDMNGVPEANAAGIGGIEIELDGMTRTRSGSDGRYVFSGIATGPHRVAARVGEGAYFTTPSVIDVDDSQRADFGISTTPARVIGRVTDDGGHPVGGISVLATRGAKQLSATSDSDGRFTIVGAPGAYELRIAAESLPSGYSVAKGNASDVILDRDSPKHAELTVRANRSVAGVTAPNASVVVRETGRTTTADSSGAFVLRDLAEGTATIVSLGRERNVRLGAEPQAVHGIRFDAAVAPPLPSEARQPSQARLPSEARLPSQARLPDRGEWFVQFGTFRQHENAVDLVGRLHAAGIDAQIVDVTRFEVVRSTPLLTVDAAAALHAKVARTGFDAIVIRRR